MERLRRDVYDANHPVAKLETKTKVKLISANDHKLVYEGIYPVEPIKKEARGTYGGDFVAQGMNVAWESISDPKHFQPHSLHCYFVKAGSPESTITWEVTKVSDTRNFANRLLLAYQGHTNKLVFTMQISFTKDNDHKKRVSDYNQLLESGHQIKSIPFVIKTTPNQKYFALKDKIDQLPYMEHTNGNLAVAFPQEFLEYGTNVNHDALGNQEFGIFSKVLDDFSLGTDVIRQSFLGLAFVSDSIWLATFTRALGLPIGSYEQDYFRVSLDHSLYFHDLNFDSSDWIFLDFRFMNMKNDRVVAVINFFTLDGNLVATAFQEGNFSNHCC
ncbi:TES1 Peroxisomal acyl-coenzyme A thioester hydrolase 1 [Candida maltosa Xu316]